MSKLLGLLLIEISGTGLMSFSCGSFVLYIEDALHFKRSAFFLINSFTILFSAISLPLFKKILKRLGASKTAFICGLFSAVNYLGFSFFKSYFWFLLLGILNGFFINGISGPIVIEVLNNDFKEKSTKLLSLILSLSTLFSAVFINVLRFINESFSYKWGYRTIAALGFLFALFGSLLIKGTSFEKSLQSKKPISFKDRQVNLYSLILLWGNLCNLALFNNLVPYLKELGTEGKAAYLLSSAVILSSVFSRIFWGFLFNTLKAENTLILLVISPFLSSLLFILGKRDILFIYVSIIFLSFNSCFNSLPATALNSQYKNKESDALTLLLFFSILGSSLGSSTCALIYDIEKSYFPFWLTILVLSLPFFLLAVYLKRHYPHDRPLISR